MDLSDDELEATRSLPCNKIKYKFKMSEEENLKEILVNFARTNKFYKDKNDVLTITIDAETKITLNNAIKYFLSAYEKEKEKNKEYKNLLIDMVNQFAYEDDNPKTKGSSEEKLHTAGLSTLEDVFDILDIDEGIKREELWKLKEE